jgi:hypothetical protein
MRARPLNSSLGEIIREMNRNTKIILTAIFAIAVFSCTFSQARSPVEEMVRNKKKRADILSELIRSNGLTCLPTEFVIEDSSRIGCSQVLNENHELLTLAGVSYDVHNLGTGSRTYIFVFDSSGKCIFHSPDGTLGVSGDNYPYDLFFCDMTGDGDIEKLVEFDLHETGKIQDSLQYRRNAFQVWRLSLDRSELLLEVHYSIFGKERKGAISPDLFWPVRSGTPPVIHVGKGIPDITLGELSKKPLVIFRWSPTKQKYVWNPVLSDRLEIEYPVAQHENSADPKGRAAD